MNKTTELLNTKIYPAIYERAEQIFPEFKFKKTAGGYVSTTDTKITGEKGKPGKVYYYGNNISHLIDYTRSSISIWDYIEGRDKLSTPQDVLLKLAELSGVALPNGDFDTEAYEKQRREAQLWEDAQQYFAVILMEAKALQKYLKEKRSYTPEDIQAMQIGCISSQEALRKHLKGKGYTDTDLKQIELRKEIGKTHTLTIPLREPGGKIRGISVRTISDAQPKYLYSTGLIKTDLLFNLSTMTGKKDLVIVEGLLDALLCSARGIENVVALGGKTLTKAQLETAVKYGAQKITLCLDNEEKTIPDILKAIDLIQREQPELKIFVAQLPKGVKDPDELIRKEEAEAFKKVIAETFTYYEYQLEQIFNKYDKIQEEQGSLTAKDKEDLLQEIETTAQRIDNARDRDQFLQIFLDNEDIKKLGITKESLKAVVEENRYKEAQEKQKKALQTLISEAQNLQREGKTAEEVIEKIEQGLPDVKATSGKGLLPPVLTYEDVINEIATIPPLYKTGYKTLDEFTGFPPGAITLIGGRPSHGKTTFMFNCLLQMSEIYPDKSFYFFSYEEPVKMIMVKLLNRLTAQDLSSHFSKVIDLPTPTNYEFLKAYIRAGRTDIEEIEKGKHKLQKLLDSQRIKVIGQSYSVEDLYSLLSYLNKKEQIGSVFIDYIQRMTTKEKTQDIRTQIVRISDQVLKIAKDTGLPIILGAQVNRGATTNRGKEPTLENLKEAGNLEEDANTVLSVFCKAREQEEEAGKKTHKDREVDLVIKTLKNREGEVNRKETLKWDRYLSLIYEKDNKPQETHNFFDKQSTK
jgi:DNA primase